MQVYSVYLGGDSICSFILSRLPAPDPVVSMGVPALCDIDGTVTPFR